MLRTLALLLALTYADLGFAQQAPGPSGEGVPDAHWVSIYYRTIDRVNEAAALLPLHTTELPEGDREVRIWIDHGIGSPHQLYRLIDNGAVSGELVLHWRAPPPDSASGDRVGETSHDLMLYMLEGRCEGFRRAADTGVCRARFTRPPDWAAALAQAEASDLWTLPDEADLPDEGYVTVDGWGLVVELRDGAEYRAYYYGNPDLRPDQPEAVRAVEIAEAVREVGALQRPPYARRAFRGITSGEYRSAFRLCGTDETWEFADELRRAAAASGVALPSGRTEDPLYYVEVMGMPTPGWVALRRGSPHARILWPIEVLAVRPWTGVECDGDAD
jgi:hypothetical protein